MDSIVHEVTKSRTRLSNFHFYFSYQERFTLYLLLFLSSTNIQPFTKISSCRNYVFWLVTNVFLGYPLCEHLGSTLSRKHQFFASLQWKFDRYLFREPINDMFVDRFTAGEIRNWVVKRLAQGYLFLWQCLLPWWMWRIKIIWTIQGIKK